MEVLMSVDAHPPRRWVVAAAAACLVAGPALAVAAAPTGVPERSAAAVAERPGRSAAAWFVAPSLLSLRAEVDARWPGRSRALDGTIGDSAHERSRNEHNPVGHRNGPRNGTPGAVHAIDITAAGIDPQAVVAAAVGDARVWYVIYDGTIWSRTYGWAGRPQRGDPHRGHIHLSLRAETPALARAAENDRSRWLSAARPASSGGMTRAAVVQLQRALIRRGYRIPAGPTGVYGGQTRAAVAAFQRAQGWRGSQADGVAGPLTLARLGVGGSAGAPRPAPAAKPRPPARAKAPARATAPKASGPLSAYRPGAANAHVHALQVALIRRGYRIPAGATGYYGARTRDAVAAFQRAQGWTGSTADGVPGLGTLRRLGLA